MMPDNGLDDQRDKDTILSGSAGDPYTPDHVTP
ncbi:tartrate dehydrogenase [Bordetella ansorpii]|uniref:Tartrate dehydrogenase n=1 Tax=Bordetella ansorpii TaxID=288768 RepID=A0A157PAW6_9BORD|nr:tartrate dehydrogenase [Bordetella ansorpii]